MASRRMERVASLLKQAIGRVIVSELKDPRMGFVTIVRVAPAPDLRTADVFVSVMGEGTEVTRTLRGLQHAAKFIKGRVGEEIKMRTIPDLRFVEDKTVKGQARVSKLIDDALAESAAVAQAKAGVAPGAPAEPGEPVPAEEPEAAISNDELEVLLEEQKDEEELAGDEEEVEAKPKPVKPGRKKPPAVVVDDEELEDEDDEEEEEDDDEDDDELVDEEDEEDEDDDEDEDEEEEEDEE